MNLAFNRLAVLIILIVLICVSLVYALGSNINAKNGAVSLSGAKNLDLPPSASINYEFNPQSLVQHLVQVSRPSNFNPPPIFPLYECEYLVFAYYAGNFVQASVMVTGPEFFNGTASADLQNPLTFRLLPGNYSISGTYNSTLTQNVTMNVVAGNLYYHYLILNFDNSTIPPLGRMIVFVWYQPSTGTAQLINAFVTISGPENHTEVSNSDFYSALIFTVAPGEYSISATWGSLQETQTVSLGTNSATEIDLVFGSDHFSPPP